MNRPTISNHLQICAALMPVSCLHPDPRNPRLHSKRQLKQIARSIQSFGFNVPILIDRSDRIVAGHGRYLAAQQLGITEVPVIRLEHLTETQARAFAIADNRLTENSSWDEAILGEIFLELSQTDLSFSLEDTGFTMGEIDLTIESLSLSDQPTDPQDDIPDYASLAPVCQLGDVWLLDKHRIVCGNALDAMSYDTLMQGHKADLIFTDAPYNVRISGHVSGKGAVVHREFAMASGEMSTAEFTQFLSGVFAHLVQHSHPGSIHFQCIDWRHMTEMLAAGTAHYSELKNVCVWVKHNGGMGSLYRSQHEFVFVFKHGTTSHRNNVALGKYGRNRTNVWHYLGANQLARQSSDEDLLAMHPTVKPIALIADAILDCSARGDIVLDSFLGSGSTILAAERVGRVGYGIELDPLYVDTAIRRWQAHTGKQAMHAGSGESFDARSAQGAVYHD
ncbi:MAG: site-specific DNA-methyltransferase [Burkholderiaceae bacterium]